MTTQPKSLKGTKTEANLVLSYLAESAAYSRYTFYAQQATKEKYFPVAQVFNETAANELHHAKVYFKFLQGGQVTVPVSADAGVIGTTAENLACAAAEELSEGVDMYKAFAKVAQEEGFDDIAEHFLAIATIEENHHNRFLRMLDQVKNGTMWKREKPITWKCLVCGYEYVGTEPPMVCPGCDHPREHYIALDDVQELV
ncbi:MAG: rubrerythrin family protein [Muribaculaceae bacterium]|nr:rubrerythrin family protein [Muribaculaceae bacterium]